MYVHGDKAFTTILMPINYALRDRQLDTIKNPPAQEYHHQTQRNYISSHKSDFGNVQQQQGASTTIRIK